MANTKIVVKFNYTNMANDLGGWSEVFYSMDTMETAIRRTQTYLQKRMMLTTGAVGVKSLEVFDLDRPGVSLRSGYIAAIGQIINPGPRSATDIPQMALAFKVRASSGNKRVVITPGIPDSWVQGGRLVDVAPSILAIAGVVQALTSSGFCIRGVDKDRVPQDLVGITTTGLVTTVSDMAWGVGNKIQLYRVRDVDGKPVKGIFPIVSTTDSKHFQLGKYGTKGLVQGGKARRYELILQPIAFCREQPKLSLRQIGRPSSPYVGRRRRAS